MKLLLAALLGLASQAAPPTAGKVVFVRGNVLATSTAAGTDVRELVRDGQQKANPRWSRDGTRISYEVPGNRETDPQSHATIVVVDVQGKRTATIPVLATMVDGSKIGGMRFVERIGWKTNEQVFAEGSANPYVAEYRIFDLRGRAVAGLWGSAFAECAQKGDVAYAADRREFEDRKARLLINMASVYTATNATTQIRDVLWSATCDRVMLRDTSIETPFSSTLVIVRGRTVEARLGLPATFVEVRTYRSGDTFLVGSADEALIYDAGSRSLKPGADALKAIRAVEAERAAVVRRLEGRDADWWTAPSSGRP